MVIGLSFDHILKFVKNTLHIRETYFKGKKKVLNDEFERLFLSLGNVKEKKKHNNKKQKINK